MNSLIEDWEMASVARGERNNNNENNDIASFPVSYDGTEARLSFQIIMRRDM